MKPMNKVLGVSLLALAMPLAANAMSDNPGQPSGNASAGATAQASVNAQAESRFSADEVRLIRDVLGAATGTDLSDDDDDDDDGGKNKKYKDKGKGKSKGLPPGIAKNLERGKPLPPGIAKRNLPDDLAARLSTRYNSKATIVGSDVVLEEIATGIVLDVIRDVLK